MCVSWRKDYFCIFIDISDELSEYSASRTIFPLLKSTFEKERTMIHLQLILPNRFHFRFLANTFFTMNFEFPFYTECHFFRTILLTDIYRIDTTFRGMFILNLLVQNAPSNSTLFNNIKTTILSPQIRTKTKPFYKCEMKTSAQKSTAFISR